MEADGLSASPANEASLRSRSSGLELQSELWTIPSSDLQKFERVGSGTYGQVYRGRWEHMAEDDVAIKELIAPVKDSTVFEREVQMMINLPHPNLLRIYGYFLDPAYIVIEFCHRGSLYDVLNDHTEHPEFTWQLRLQIARRIAQGMSFMHSHNVLHRDLKSPNVMLTGDWAVKIADFGYARHCRSSVATSGTRPSNPIWVDPELLRNPERPCDTSTDVYSFGIILHELLFLELPCGDLLKEHHGLFKLMARLVFMREDISSFFDFGDERLPEGRRTPGIDAYLQLLRDCVKLEAHERPLFKSITATLNDIIASESPLPQPSGSSLLDPYGTSSDFSLDNTSSTLRGSSNTRNESYGNPNRNEDDHGQGESPIHEVGSGHDKPMLHGLTDYEARCVRMAGTRCGDLLGEANAFEAINNNDVATLTSLLQTNRTDDHLRGAAITRPSHLADQAQDAINLIHQQGGLKITLDLLNSRDLPVLEASTAMLSLLAESADAQRLLVSHQGVPKLLHTIMETGSVTIQANAAKCLRLIAENSEYHQEFLSCNAVEGFMQQLKVAEEPQLRSELAFLLFYFAQHIHSTKVPLLEAIGAMDVLEECLQLPLHSQKAEFIVCECCTRALTDIAVVSPTARYKLAAGNAARQLAVLLHTSNEGCRDAALCALTTLAVEPDVCESIGSYGIMGPVLKLLDADTPELQQAMSVELVARVAQEVANRGEIAQAIPALGNLLTHEHTQQWAATALAYLTEEPRLAASVAALPDVLSTLLENIESGDKKFQRPTTEVLKNICELVPSARQAVCAIPDYVELLLDIVSKEHDPTRQHSLRTLQALSDDLNHRCNESAAAFAAQFKAARLRRSRLRRDDLPGVAVITQLLRSRAPSDTYQAALGLLWNVSLRESLDHVWAGPDAEMLVRFLGHHDATCQQAAAGVISCITFNHRANQAAIVEAQGVPHLMSMLSEGHEQLHSTALDAICNLSYSNPGAQQAVCASDGINMLRRFVERGHPKQQVAAALVYRNIAQDAQLRHQVIHSGAPSAIVSMIMSGHVSRYPRPRHRDDITRCYLAACQALSTITHNDRELLEMLATTNGLFDQIMHVWLSCGAHDGLLLSTSALIYSFISHVASIMPDLSIEVLGRLLSMLEADHPAKLEMGVNLLCGVMQAHDSTVEHMLLEVGALPRVVKLLESRRVKVQLCGVRALLGLAISDVVTDHMDKVALEPLLRKMAQELSDGDREAVDTLMLHLGIIL